MGTRASFSPWMTSIGVRIAPRAVCGDDASKPRSVHVWVAELELHLRAPVGRAVEAAQLPQAGVGHDRAEAVGVAGDPVGHVAAERAAHRHGPLRVDVVARDRRVDRRHQVRERLLTPAPQPRSMNACP